MTNIVKKKVPLKEGFWKMSSETDGKPQLIGSKCTSCGEVFFPKKEKNWCVHCNQACLKETALSSKGKIGTFSVVLQQPGGGFYKGPVPYSYGCVDLDDGLKLETLFTTDNFDALKVGMDVELVIEKLYEDDDGNDVETFKFQPLS
jgi:uncharacterized OB-fold protein